MEDSDQIASADEFVEVPAPVKPEAPASADGEAPVQEAAPTDEAAAAQAGVEKRIAKIVWQREDLARKHEEAMRRIAFLEGQAAGGKPQEGGKKADDDAGPKQDQYESYDDYMAAVVEHRVERALVAERARRDQEDKAKETDRRVQDRLKVAREKHADWDAKVRNPDLDITPDMGRVILHASQGADIAYWLASNPAEASRISRLDPSDQIVEVGKIAARLDVAPSLPEPSKAPAPIVPVRGSATKPARDPSKENDSQWWYSEQKEDARRRKGA